MAGPATRATRMSAGDDGRSGTADGWAHRLGATLDASALGGGMVLLGLGAVRTELLWLRMAGLGLAAGAIAHGIARDRGVPRTVGLADWPRRLSRKDSPGYHAVSGAPNAGRWWLWLAGSLILGIAWGSAHRLCTGRSMPPAPPSAFCLLAIGIGLCEELLYRGFLQGWLRGRGRWRAVLGAAAAHAAYKCGIFILPAGPDRADLPALAAITFAGGIILGLLRERLGNLAFPASAHAMFDAVAYGDLAAAPWWVW
jgi:hypothetical protein